MSFRRLAHGFTVRSDDPAIGAYLARVLERFAVSEGCEGWTTYEVRDMGPEEQSRFHLLIDGERALAGADPAPVLDELFSHVNRDTIEAAGDHVLVHAGAVVTPEGRGVLLPAPSGSGKSTLVAALVQAGFGYLSDEAAVLDPATGDLHAYPVHLSLKATSRDSFPEVAPAPDEAAYSNGTWHVDPDALRPGSVVARCRVGFVIPHRYEPGTATQIESLTPAEACVHLGTNLMNGRRDGARSLGLLAKVSLRSKGYRLTHGDLDEAVRAIVDLTSR
ncbi:MAG: hypothetical protein ABI595_14825 [Actinomycetota bacterium]